MKNFGLFFISTALAALIFGSIAFIKLSRSVEEYTAHHASLTLRANPELADTLE
jgi:hypothetical protein